MDYRPSVVRYSLIPPLRSGTCLRTPLQHGLGFIARKQNFISEVPSSAVGEVSNFCGGSVKNATNFEIYALADEITVII